MHGATITSHRHYRERDIGTVSTLMLYRYIKNSLFFSLKMGNSRHLFLYFHLFNTQLTVTNVQYIYKILPMTGF